jgi:hypothetical protein
MIPTTEILLIIAGVSAPILAMWNSLQATQIKRLQLQMEKLCDTCEYDYTPIKKNKTPTAS